MVKAMTRRMFVGAATGVGLLALGGLAGCAPQESAETGSSAQGTWDEEVDLLIAGCGGAGMACAIEAKDSGVENVLIVEKMPQTGGTTTLSQGMIAGYDTKLQKEQGVSLTYDEMYANLMNNASYHLDPLLTKITMESCGQTIDWLADRVKVPFTDKLVTTYGPLPMMHVVEDGGMGFSKAFTAVLEELGVEVRINTRLMRIVTNADGSVAGVEVDEDGKTVRIGARAVMVATGGYAHNPELAARLDPEKAGTFGIGNIACEGDGLIAASNVGAGLSHTNDMMCVLKDYTIMSEHDGTSASANVNGFTNLENMILVGAGGRRFCNEGGKGYMSQALNEPVFDQMHRDGKGYVWMISDQATVDATEGKTHRGEDLSYLTGSDVVEFARALEVDADALGTTIDEYNAAVDAGVDREFGRFPTAKLVAPFVALPVVPCEIITYGGLMRNENAEVIRADGTAIPGLYTGGEASCNSAYMGFTLSNCFTWGRRAGASAARYLGVAGSEAVE